VSRVVRGTSDFKILVGGGGGLEGTSGLVSERNKLNFLLKFANQDYRGEQFITEGDKVYVAATLANHKRSSFADLVHNQDQIVREGLLGGTLSTAWALLSLDRNQPRLKYEGMKKVDGRQLHDLLYQCKKSGEMNIHLYFEPETFRHVMTVCTITLAAGLGTSVPSPTDQFAMTIKLTGRRSDAKLDAKGCPVYHRGTFQ
jgi:hypothetical protein